MSIEETLWRDGKQVCILAEVWTEQGEGTGRSVEGSSLWSDGRVWGDGEAEWQLRKGMLRVEKLYFGDGEKKKTPQATGVCRRRQRPRKRLTRGRGQGDFARSAERQRPWKPHTHTHTQNRTMSKWVAQQDPGESKLFWCSLSLFLCLWPWGFNQQCLTALCVCYHSFFFSFFSPRTMLLIDIVWKEQKR